MNALLNDQPSNEAPTDLHRWPDPLLCSSRVQFKTKIRGFSFSDQAPLDLQSDECEQTIAVFVALPSFGRCGKMIEFRNHSRTKLSLIYEPESHKRFDSSRT